MALGPGRFYGSSLPRPRYYPDPKLNSSRVDPPESVMDPFLSWANEAHWSMGGLSFRRLRLQGRIEGSISKLRKSMSPKRRKASTRFTKQRLACLDEEDDEEPETDEEVYDSDLEEEEVDEEDEEEESEEEMEVNNKKRKRARRLGEEFDRIAEEAKKKEKGEKKVNKRGKGKGKGEEKEVEKQRRVSLRKK